MEIKKNISLKQWSWWQVGGVAEFCCLPRNLVELKSACHFAQKHQVPIHILSGGTNTLISDLGVKGLVIVLKELNHIEVQKSKDQIKITALAGTPKYELFKICSKHKLASSFFLCGLPGDVGGGVVMNAGVGQSLFPKEFSQIVHSIEVLNFSDFNLHSFKKEDLSWNYRSCTGWEEGLVYRVVFCFKNEIEKDYHQKLKDVRKRRLSTQPLNKPSCGSVFKNPSGHKSGQLIEKLGLKGYKIGGAEVSTKHANFIINTGEAKAFDIYNLICHVQKEVKEKLNVDLEPEIQYMGDFKQL